MSEAMELLGYAALTQPTGLRIPHIFPRGEEALSKRQGNRIAERDRIRSNLDGPPDERRRPPNGIIQGRIDEAPAKAPDEVREKEGEVRDKVRDEVGMLRIGNDKTPPDLYVYVYV